jgi:hypothetical protein
MKIIYQGRVWSDEEAPRIEVSDVCSVPDEELTDLLSQILDTLESRKHMDGAIDIIQNRTGLVSPEEVKAANDLKLKNTSLYYYRDFSLNSVSMTEEIPDYKIKDVANEKAVYLVEVELPPSIQKQVDEYKKLQRKEEKRKADRKKQKAILKAKKLLESVSEV